MDPNQSSIENAEAVAENADAVASPTLDESLAQLEEALDLFASAHDQEEAGKATTDEVATNEIATGEVATGEVATAASAVTAPPTAPLAEPKLMAAAPIKDDSFEQAIKELKRVIANPQTEPLTAHAKAEVLMIPPAEAEMDQRRFPLLTDGQKKLLGVTAILLAFFVLIGYLIWQRQRNDELRLAADQRAEARLRAPLTPVAAPTPLTEASPVTANPADEQSLADNRLAENIRQILIAYNPTAATTRYKIDVKESVVTLSGDVQSQMEKDGAENVIKPLTGIKKVVNNLQVRGFQPGPSGASTPNGPVMFPQVNPVEAKRLEEALKRDLAEGAKRAEEERLRIEQQNAQLTTQRNADEAAKQEAAKVAAQEAAKEAARESERLRRQQSAVLQNEEDAAFRKQAEDRQKQKEEAERRAEEQRKTEAAAPPKVEAAPEPTHIRSGTVAWRGLVKGVDDIVMRGTSSTIQHVMGELPREPKGSFSTAMPEAPMSVRLVAASGPSPIRIIQQPSASNNFTTIVRVGEGNKADGKPHSFTLRWAAQ